MAYSTIPKASLYMNTKLYNGNGGTQSITGINFQPDWLWIKTRNQTESHQVVDVLRGSTKVINANANSGENTQANGVTSFDSDGFNVGNFDGTNDSAANLVAWNWKAGGAGSANTNGSISSSVSVNTTAGFSVVKWTGSGANATVGHGLGVKPAMIIVKNATGTGNWRIWNKNLGLPQTLELNSNAAANTSPGQFNSSATVNSTVFSVGGEGDTNESGSTIIAYCFSEIQGYSKMGAYMGNGSTGGSSGIGTNFVHCGFSPAFVLIKNGQQVNDWLMFDNKRQGFNPENEALDANLTSAERTTNYLNFFSNGFGLSSTSGEVNSAGVPYIFQAFAENPFVATSGTTAVPATAR
tara:strand:- start:8 stop:1066 length:1059 start_codon:yes stop_codon:yes gene_type:complete